MYKKMLIPLDRSELAEIVFPYARQLAGRLGLEIVLLNVAREEDRDLLAKYKSYLDRQVELLVNQSHYVQRKCGLTGEKTVRVQSVVSVGNPAEEIVKYAKENDLIIIPHHQEKKGLDKIIETNVSKEVVKNAPCSVLVVKLK